MARFNLSFPLPIQPAHYTCDVCIAEAIALFERVTEGTPFSGCSCSSTVSHAKDVSVSGANHMYTSNVVLALGKVRAHPGRPIGRPGTQQIPGVLYAAEGLGT